MKKPEEIKKGLVEAVAEMFWATKDGDDNAMRRACGMAHTSMADALAYIQQLEADVENLMGMLRDAERANMKEVAKNLDEIINGRRWIPVEERLPEERAVVLVVREEILYGREVTIGWQRCGKWELPIGAKITHWMPLPEPPEVNKP